MASYRDLGPTNRIFSPVHRPKSQQVWLVVIQNYPFLIFQSKDEHSIFNSIDFFFKKKIRSILDVTMDLTCVETSTGYSQPTKCHRMTKDDSNKRYQ